MSGTLLKAIVHGNVTADTTPAAIDVSATTNSGRYLLHVRVASGGVEVCIRHPLASGTPISTPAATALAALPGAGFATFGPWSAGDGNPKAYAASSQAAMYVIEEVWGEA